MLDSHALAPNSEKAARPEDRFRAVHAAALLHAARVDVLLPDIDPSAPTLVPHALAWWRAADGALTPLIGRNGVALSFRQAVAKTRALRGWIPELPADESLDARLAALATALSLHPPEEAASAQGTLACAFRDIVASLIGSSLAARLLPPIRRSFADSEAMPVAAHGDPSPQYEPTRADLREANEHLMLAALDSREMQADAEDIHHRQVKFLATVVHELRNPLAPIRMAGELLHRAVANETLLLRLQTTIRRQSAQMARLLDDLLDGARAGAGKFRFEFEPLVLSEVLEPILETLRHTVATRGQHLAVRLPAEPVVVRADALRLAQIFANLADNASKYTPREGQVSIDVEHAGETLTIAVMDDGIGITAEAMPHIFELFVQEPHARAHNGAGLGIGLAVVRELVEAHGGSIAATSPGKHLGSRFVVTLPVPRVDVRSAA